MVCGLAWLCCKDNPIADIQGCADMPNAMCDALLCYHVCQAFYHAWMLVKEGVCCYVWSHFALPMPSLWLNMPMSLMLAMVRHSFLHSPSSIASSDCVLGIHVRLRNITADGFHASWLCCLAWVMSWKC
ncbi:hypothetical protein U1Q18_034352 [Sarracenia purpurea var. burkii]